MTDEATIKPVVFEWTGAEMRPLARFDNLVHAQYVVGEHYTLAPIARSRKHHNHFFACIQRAWENLPEEIAEKLPDAKTLRKWALIKAGFRIERVFTANSPEQALAVAAFARPKDGYAVIMIDGNTVTIYEAKSQAELAMDRAEFSKAKRAVLDIVSRLIGVDVTTLRKAATDNPAQDDESNG
jgi:hypothetical protein